jgi:hypothetical protein
MQSRTALPLAITAAIEPPRKDRQHEQAAGHHHHHQIRAHPRESFKVPAQSFAVLRRPAQAVTLLHQQGHQLTGLRQLVQQTAPLPIAQTAQGRKGKLCLGSELLQGHP